MPTTFRTCLAPATLLTLSGAWASSPPEDLAALTLSRQLELGITELFNVLEAEEGATYARYRLVARLSARAVARRIGEALPAPWQPQSTRPSTDSRGPLSALAGFSGHKLTYLNKATAQSLSIRAHPIGRSNLFRLELRLSAPTRQP